MVSVHTDTLHGAYAVSVHTDTLHGPYMVSLHTDTLHGAYMVSVHTDTLHVSTWSLYILTRTHTRPGITIKVDWA